MESRPKRPPPPALDVGRQLPPASPAAAGRVPASPAVPSMLTGVSASPARHGGGAARGTAAHAGTPGSAANALAGVTRAPSASPAALGTPGRVQVARQACNCKNSRCLKLYCICFSSGVYCDGCNCVNCCNNQDAETVRQRAIDVILERNPNAFRPKIAGAADGQGRRAKHSKGCNCRKSSCLKKYCECFQAGIFCGENCKCVDCKNFVGSAQLAAVRQHVPTPQTADAATPPPLKRARTAGPAATPVSPSSSALVGPGRAAHASSPMAAGRTPVHAGASPAALPLPPATPADPERRQRLQERRVALHTAWARSGLLDEVILLLQEKTLEAKQRAGAEAAAEEDAGADAGAEGNGGARGENGAGEVQERGGDGAGAAGEREDDDLLCDEGEETLEGSPEAGGAAAGGARAARGSAARRADPATEAKLAVLQALKGVLQRVVAAGASSAGVGPRRGTFMLGGSALLQQPTTSGRAGGDGGPTLRLISVQEDGTMSPALAGSLREADTDAAGARVHLHLRRAEPARRGGVRDTRAGTRPSDRMLPRVARWCGRSGRSVRC
ncbi:unnamed protein product [Pedinophyceae sp. YPF-701]|nr:unnamed protein product [Pedinophyceae sp. YPF-701]